MTSSEDQESRSAETRWQHELHPFREVRPDRTGTEASARQHAPSADNSRPNVRRQT